MQAKAGGAWPARGIFLPQTDGRPLRGLPAAGGDKRLAVLAPPVRRETRARAQHDARGLPEPPKETLWEGEREKEQA